MSLDHCLVGDSPDTEKAAALGGPLDPAAALIRSRDGPTRPIQPAPPQRRSPPREGGKIAATADVPTEVEPIGFTSQTVPCHGSNTPTNDLWDPPTTRSQHMRQQVVAVVLAFILAALLGQIGL